MTRDGKTASGRAAVDNARVSIVRERSENVDVDYVRPDISADVFFFVLLPRRRNNGRRLRRASRILSRAGGFALFRTTRISTENVL